MLTLFEIAALLLALSAFFGWFNHAFVHLPHTIGLVVMALIASLALLGFEYLFPALGITDTLQNAVRQIDFYSTVMEGLLAFLLFAGALLGAVTGWLAYRAMARIDEYPVEILVSLGIAAATYAIALRLHLSGPIAVVITGLLLGNRGARIGMSEETQSHLFGFWELVDVILNSVLFLLIGLEVLVLSIDTSFGWIALAAIPLVLAARLVSVSVPILGLSFVQSFTGGAIPVLTWGGLRGGISVALALSIPDIESKPLILTATYTVVLFSVIVQGLTVNALVNRTVDPTLL